MAFEIFTVSKTFPKEEKYGLTSQIRRSSMSVSANIAEGSGRNSPKEFIQFLGIASGSAHETIERCLIAKRIGYLDEEIADKLIFRYRGLAIMIRRFITSKRK